MRGAAEIAHGERQRPGHAEQGETALGGHHPVAVEHQLVRDEAHGGELRDVEEFIRLHVLIPLVESHVDRGGFNHQFHAAFFRGGVEGDLAAGFVEAAALGGEAEVVDLEHRPGVGRVDGVAVGGMGGCGEQGGDGDDAGQMLVHGFLLVN